MEVQNMIPDHLDLQKIGDLYINKEKYKVLKPAIHSVTDHFQDTLMRRETDLPSDRVFLDGNGFRHFWNVFNKRSKSLRRLIPDNEVDVMEGQDNVETDTRRKVKQRSNKGAKAGAKSSNAKSINAKATNVKTSNTKTSDVKGTKGTKTKAGNAKSATIKLTTKASKATMDESGEETTKANPTTKDGPKRKTPGRYSVRKKTLNKKKPENSLRSITKLLRKKDPKGDDDGKERTLVKTTFFCPFFGVMTMHSYLDDDAPKADEENKKDKDTDKDKDEDKGDDKAKDKDEDKGKDKAKDKDKK